MFNEPKLRATQKEATAQAVLDAAREEFERVGFDGANLRAIAARAKVSPGTIIHHYGDKRVLLHAALFEDLEKTLQQAIADVGKPPLEAQLSRLCRSVFAYYERRPALSRTLLKESLFADAEWAQKFTAQVTQVHGVIARLADEAVKRGELREGLSAPLFAVAWFSFFYFALIGWVQGGNATPVALVDHLVAQHLEGLRPNTPKKKRSRR